MSIIIGLAKERRKKLENELEKIIPEITELDVEKIILFGSLNTGRVHATSDIDLIIIKQTDKRFMDRLDRFYTNVDSEVAVDMLVYTPDEFEDMKLNSQFVRTAMENSRVIYER